LELATPVPWVKALKCYNYYLSRIFSPLTSPLTGPSVLAVRKMTVRIMCRWSIIVPLSWTVHVISWAGPVQISVQLIVWLACLAWKSERRLLWEPNGGVVFKTTQISLARTVIQLRDESCAILWTRNAGQWAGLTLPAFYLHRTFYVYSIVLNQPKDLWLKAFLPRSILSGSPSILGKPRPTWPNPKLRNIRDFWGYDFPIVLVDFIFPSTSRIGAGNKTT
jgi:hypothetical protein